MQKNRDPHFSLKVPRLIEGEATGRFAIIALAIIAAARFARPALFTAMVIWMTSHEVYQIGKDRAASVALQGLSWSPGGLPLPCLVFCPKCDLRGVERIRVPITFAPGELERDAPEPSFTPNPGVNQVDAPDVAIAVEDVVVFVLPWTALAEGIGAAEEKGRHDL